MKKITLKWKVTKKSGKTVQKSASYYNFKSCKPCGE